MARKRAFDGMPRTTGDRSTRETNRPVGEKGKISRAAGGCYRGQDRAEGKELDNRRGFGAGGGM